MTGGSCGALRPGRRATPTGGVRPRRAVLTALLAALALGGCGQDGPRPDPSPTPTSAADRAALACQEFELIFAEDVDQTVEQGRARLRRARDHAVRSGSEDARHAPLGAALTELVEATGDLPRVTAGVVRVQEECRALRTPTPSASG